MAFDNLSRHSEIGIVGMSVSGRAVYEYLCRHAHRLPHIVLRDRDPMAVRGVEGCEGKVTVMVGEDWDKRGSETLYFRSPIIPADLPLLGEARARGATVTSEAQLFCDISPCVKYGITGSSGKTTCVSLAREILELAYPGRAYAAGNIGTPLLSLADSLRESDYIVAELSSFQTEDLTADMRGVLWLNLTENHLDRHRSMAEYEAAKARLLYSASHRVLCADDPITSKYIRRGDRLWTLRAGREKDFPSCRAVTCDGTYVLADGERIFDISRLRLKGRHNLSNAMAVTALLCGEVPTEAIRRGIESFGGVEHRMEQLGRIGTVDCYDSGIDTTPARTEVTLAAMGTKVCVICGGSDKGLCYAPLADALCIHAGCVALTGATADKILQSLQSCESYREGSPHIIYEPDFERCVEAAYTYAEAQGLPLILSPGCASFDRFSSYKERSRIYREILSKMRK